MTGSIGLPGDRRVRGVDSSERLHAIKHAPERHHVAITDADGRGIGSLVPIGPEAVRDDELVERLVEWRAQHMQVFASRFTPTPARTRDYLERIAVAKNDRILFKILKSGGLVGHV